MLRKQNGFIVFGLEHSYEVEKIGEEYFQCRILSEFN